MSDENEQIPDEAIWDEFWSAGACGGGIVRHCEKHDLVFFNDDERAGTWEEGELEKLREQAQANPKKYIALDGDAHTTFFAGHEWLWDCQGCRRDALDMQNRLWLHRDVLARFLNKRLLTEKRRAMDEFNQLSIRTIASGPSGWNPMTTAPKDATEVMLLMNTQAIYPRAHWADGGGEEQPAFRGWFVQDKETKTCHEIRGTPDGWLPIPKEEPK